MSQITSMVNQERGEVVIRINGRFDFSLHRLFREAYRAHAPKMKYSVDLSSTEYLDSSALGMLLLLREHAGGDHGRVALRGATKDIRQLLNIARFDQLFDMG